MTTSAVQSPTLSIGNDVVVLIADLQAGISDLPLTLPGAQLGRNVAALLELVRIFDLPLIVSAVPGADGGAPVLMKELAEGLGQAAPHLRTTPNSFSDGAIRRAIDATGRKILVVSGVATEVAVQLPSLSALAAGYDVRVLVDACGGISARTEDAALRRMSQAGVKTSSLPTFVGELAGDFSQPRGQQAIAVLFKLAGG